MSSLRIGTYNILMPRTDHLTKGVASWIERKESVIDTIDQEFDFVGLQEVEFNEPHLQGEQLTEELENRGWVGYIPSRDKLFKDRFHERLPIFWRPEVFKLHRAGQILLSSWLPHELSQVPILENRYGSFVKGTLSSGQKLTFYTLHFQHQTSGAQLLESQVTQLKRAEAQRSLVTHLLNNQEKDELVIIAGDFNSSEPLLEFAAAGIREVNSVVENLERWDHDSFHDWKDPKNGNHFDRVFISKEVSGGSARIGDSLASDHYPVVYKLNC